MFAVGHLALGYITGKGAARFLNVSVNIPLIFLASILPDIDFLIPGLMHRGPMHSIILYALIFIPVLILYKKTGVIYFLCIAQHLILGDYLTAGCGEGIQLLWPLTSNWYSAGIYLANAARVYLEWIFFVICLAWMFRAGDLRKLLVYNRSNLLLAAPILSIVLPVFFDIPLHAPLLLLVPHIVFLLLFSLSILISLRTFLKRLTSSSSER
jgi:hypothetical protein